MLTLASMIYAAFMFIGTELNMIHSVPIPVVIETGISYNYNDIDAAITVPLNWTDSCSNQSLVVHYMLLHFNSFRNGVKKLDDDQMANIAHKWVCIQ
jgi:hypothetical protein